MFERNDLHRQADPYALFISEAELHIVEEIGVLFEKWGVPRASGRITGLLMLSHRPLNQEEIARLLGLSRASVSSNLQMGQSSGLIRIVPRRKTGDRRDYYEITTASLETSFISSDSRLKELGEIAEGGLNMIDQNNYAARQRFQAISLLYECFHEAMQFFEQRWKERKSELNVSKK